MSISGIEMPPILEVKNLKKYFSVNRNRLFKKGPRVFAVDDVSFNLNEGETLGLVGDSGSGKTAIGRCILRLVEPTGGEVRFNGENILTIPREKMREMRRKMQIIFQDPYGSLTPRMKIGDLLRESLVTHNFGNKKDRMDRVAIIMRKVGLRPEHMNRYPHEFSGGQRQRISIARAMIINPQIVIAEEPVSALDVSIRAQVINLLAELQEEYHLSYLLIAHDLSVVQYFSWASNILRGDFGRSLSLDVQVSKLILEKFPTTMLLALTATSVSLIIAIMFGTIAAFNKGSIVDLFSLLVALVWVSIPSFWLAILSIILFALKIPILPSMGYADPTVDLIDGIRHLILPAATLGAVFAGAITRMVRAEMIEQLLEQDRLKTPAKVRGFCV